MSCIYVCIYVHKHTDLCVYTHIFTTQIHHNESKLKLNKHKKKKKKGWKKIWNCTLYPKYHKNRLNSYERGTWLLIYLPDLDFELPNMSSLFYSRFFIKLIHLFFHLIFFLVFYSSGFLNSIQEKMTEEKRNVYRDKKEWEWW